MQTIMHKCGLPIAQEWNLYPPHLFSYLLYKSASLFLKTLSHNFRNVPIISNLFSKYRNSITVQSGEENENEEFVQIKKTFYDSNRVMRS
jgi:hypothetical protein